IQLDYQKRNISQHDAKFKENFFDYAYVGKFTGDRSNFYATQFQDSASQRQATVLQGSVPNGLMYTPDPENRNPSLQNYTKELYSQLPFGILPSRISDVQGFNAIANGDEPKYTYDLFLSPGSTQSQYLKLNSNQYALTVDASFDLLAGKTKHNIEFGLY